jgi:hypothetical protein
MFYCLGCQNNILLLASTWVAVFAFGFRGCREVRPAVQQQQGRGQGHAGDMSHLSEIKQHQLGAQNGPPPSPRFVCKNFATRIKKKHFLWYFLPLVVKNAQICNERKQAERCKPKKMPMSFGRGGDRRANGFFFQPKVLYREIGCV